MVPVFLIDPSLWFPFATSCNFDTIMSIWQVFCSNSVLQSLDMSDDLSQVQLHADEDVAEVRSCSDQNGIKLNKQNHREDQQNV